MGGHPTSRVARSRHRAWRAPSAAPGPRVRRLLQRGPTSHVARSRRARRARRPTVERWHGRRASARRRPPPPLLEGGVSVSHQFFVTTGGDAAYCVTWGMTLWHANTPKLADAKAAAQMACDAGFVSGCDLVGQVDADIQAAEAAVAAAWTPVAQISDQIAQVMWMVEYEVSQLLQMAPLRQRVAGIQIHGSRLRIAAMIQQNFCPAKKAFVANAGAVEFAKRAAAHCKDDPPVG